MNPEFANRQLNIKAVTLNVAASIFMGQTEAPLTIKPFIAGMTESELFTIMTCGMAHVSGAVMAAYVAVGHVEICTTATASWVRWCENLVGR